MRYILRKYGEFNGLKVPTIIRALKDLIPNEIPLEYRNKDIFETDFLIIIQNYNRNNIRELVSTVLKLRRKDLGKLIYLPGPFNPYDFPVLFYLGIDILDASFLDIMGEESCIYPTGINNGVNCREWNNRLLDRIMNEIEISLKTFNFRELVEFYSHSSFSQEILRLLDMEYYDEIKEFLDHEPKNLKSSGLESIFRAEFREYRERIMNFKQKANNLLLIPCSAVKPYSMSKSHRVLHSYIGKYLKYIDEVIVTSPLGLVPREIESFYPAAFYDIPVTGYWFEEEKKMLIETAKNYFKDKKYDRVFYILPEGEEAILNIFDEKMGIRGKLNAENSEKLVQILEREIVKKSFDKRKIEILNILNYYYEIVLDNEDIKIVDQGNREIVYVNGIEFAKITRNGPYPMKGLAQYLASNRRKVIEIKESVKSSNIFIPVVAEISDDIRPGDPVIILNNGKIEGYGFAAISKNDLNYIKKGIAVRDFKRL